MNCGPHQQKNPIRASLADDLESFQHVSIGERLRTSDDGPIDSSSGLAPADRATSDTARFSNSSRLPRGCRRTTDPVAASLSPLQGCAVSTDRSRSELWRPSGAGDSDAADFRCLTAPATVVSALRAWIAPGYASARAVAGSRWGSIPAYVAPTPDAAVTPNAAPRRISLGLDSGLHYLRRRGR